MSFKLIPTKLSRKDLLVLYNVTHPTLRTWLQRAGLGYFKGRRKFLAHEVVLIFQAIGRPRLARQAAQRLKDAYARVNGLLPDEVYFQQQYKEPLPPQHQDQLEDSEEELDAAAIHHLEKKQEDDPIHITDALVRLTITAIYLKGQKARKQQILSTTTKRKRLHKYKRYGIAA